MVFGLLGGVAAKDLRGVELRARVGVSLSISEATPGALLHTILYYTILYYTILYYTILYDTILYYTILYYTILHIIHNIFIVYYSSTKIAA